MPSPSIRWNVLANFGGQGWRAVMALVFVPFYLRILGVEAYGLIGLYTSLQMGLALLDAGLRPTLAREMARFTGAGLDATGIRTLLRSVELPMIALAAVIVFGMAAAAPWLAHHWVHPQHLSDDVVSRSFTVMGLVAAAQFIESLYDSCLSGLQRQVLQNAIITVMATLRGCGALVVILIVPSVAAFFLWQAIVAVVSLVTLGSAVYRALPKAHGPVRFSVAELRRIRGHPGGDAGWRAGAGRGAVRQRLLPAPDRAARARRAPQDGGDLPLSYAYFCGPGRRGGGHAGVLRRSDSELVGPQSRGHRTSRPGDCVPGFGRPVQFADRDRVHDPAGPRRDPLYAADQLGDARVLYHRAGACGRALRRRRRGRVRGAAQSRRNDRQCDDDFRQPASRRSSQLVARRCHEAARDRLLRWIGSPAPVAAPRRIPGRSNAAGQCRRGDPAVRNPRRSRLAQAGPSGLPHPSPAIFWQRPMTEPINVVIPTRERADTLAYALETVVGQDSDRLRIWVSDNASSPATREVVESFGDPRIRYLNTGRRISMAHNYEFALSHVDEGWIVMIGDDDGLLTGRLELAVAELEASGLRAMATETCFYNWPGAAPEEDVRLAVPMDKRSEVIEGRDGIARMLRLAGHDFRMPQTYTGGIVHAEVVKRIRSIKGTFYQSQIPDVYSGYAICSTIDRYLFTRKPFAIAGRSGHSIGAQLFSMKKTAFLEEGLIPFHEDFPLPEVGTLTFSMPAMIYECYTQACYLHGGNPPISKQRMLDMIVGCAPHGREQTLAWGRLFAERHGLDYEAALRRAGPIWRDLRRIEIRRQVLSLWNGARVFAGDDAPLGNVAEAARTADALLRNPPRRITQFAKGAARRLKRKLRG
ncbi:MAG: glycosyltransferase [Novosphingobium sp.]|nr:glycosyltransferase [Novosphingobium sp.]